MKRKARIIYHSTFCWGIFAVSVGLFMLLSPLLWVALKAGGLEQPRYAFQHLTWRFHRWYVGMLVQIVPRVRWVFIPPQNPAGVRGPAILVANHTSVVDLLLLMSVLGRCSIVGKRSMLYIPFFGLVLAMNGMIFVERRKKFEAGEVFDLMRERLRQGEIVLTFPQGSRSIPWSRRTIKRGIFKLALEERVPIVPIAISGTGYILKKGQFFFDIPGRLKVMVHLLPPVEPDGDPGRIEDVKAIRDRVASSVESILESERDLTREKCGRCCQVSRLLLF